MSVLIKGMRIPENCTRCDHIGLNVAIGCPVMSGTNGRATDCPLVDLGKHGQLIEKPDVSEYEVFDEDTGTIEISLLGLMECHRMVENAKTIIEAEDGT